jgi:hypothetical protein
MSKRTQNQYCYKLFLNPILIDVLYLSFSIVFELRNISIVLPDQFLYKDAPEAQKQLR